MVLSSLRKQLRRAVTRLRNRGLDGEEPIAELQFLGSHRDELDAELRAALSRAQPRDVAALVRVARLLRRDALTDEIADAALRKPAPVAAKQEAVEVLREWGVDIPEPVASALLTSQDFLAAPDADGLERVLALPDAWRVAVVEEWLGGATAATAAMLDRVLDTSAGLDEAVVDRLGRSGDVEAVALLRRLEEGASGELTKRVRRALHQLRAAGVDVDADGADGDAFSFAIQPDTVHEAQAHVTGIDGDGGRIAWVLTPTPTGGDQLLEVVLDATRGVRKAELLSIRRRDLRQHLDRLRAERGILVARLPTPEVAALLAGAESQTAAAGGELPEAYRSWQSSVGTELLGVADPEAAERALAELGGDESDRERMREAVELLGDAAFSNWAVFGDSVQRAAEGVRRAETSTVVVDEEQRKAAVDAAISGVAEIFDPELRSSFRARLRDMARVLQAVGRADEARNCLAAGQGFVDLQDLYSDHPFARALMQRGVLVAYQNVRDNETPDETPDAEDSPIIRP